MTNSTPRKTYTECQLTGHKGEYILAARITRKCDWIYRQQSIADIGIDGEIEIVDAGHPCGLIKIQAKATKGKWPKPLRKDLDYWSTLPMPVLWCRIDVNNGRVHWWDVADIASVGWQKAKEKYRRVFSDKSKLALQQLANRYTEVRQAKGGLWIPKNALQIAFVGQNLLETLRSLAKKDSRKLKELMTILRKHNKVDVKCCFVLQDPVALKASDPGAWKDLREHSVDYLCAIATNLGNVARNVQVVLHRASTLSMTVVDWDCPSKIAMIVPKLQLDPDPRHRVPIIIRGGVFDKVIRRGFNKMLRPYPKSAGVAFNLGEGLDKIRAGFAAVR